MGYGFLLRLCTAASYATLAGLKVLNPTSAPKFVRAGAGADSCLLLHNVRCCVTSPATNIPQQGHVLRCRSTMTVYV